MHRFTILVDAGYLLRQAAEILSNKTPKTGRGDITIVDPQGLIQMLVQKTKVALQNNNLLRVYWYDGVKTTMTAEHKAIMALEDVQFRAGTVNGNGQQKGVDSRIVTDLVELAGHHAVCDALLVTGDGDLAIGIELAQRRGVRVAVLGVEDMTVGVHHSQSGEVVSVADRVVRIGRADIAPYIHYTPRSAQVAPANGKNSAPSPAPQGALAAAFAKASTPKSAQPAAAPAAGNTSSQAQSACQPQSSPASGSAARQAPGQAAAQKQTLDAADKKLIETTIDEYIRNQSPPLTKDVVTTTGSIEQSIDSGLLYAVMVALGGKRLSLAARNHARAVFRAKAVNF